MNKLLLVALLIFTSQTFAQQVAEPVTCTLPATQELRYCGVAARDAEGVIVRRSDVLASFRKVHPCPATGLVTGACPNWQMDHVIPLACGGCDSINNLQWLPINIKTTAKIGKDRFERKIYCKPMIIVK
jgi:hypothetical protein